MTVRGIEAIKLYLAPTNAKIDTNVKEEKGKQVTVPPTIDSLMTSVERYRQEWRQLLSGLQENFDCIRDLAFNGELRVSKFRSVYWSVLLRVLNADSNSWKDQRQQQRNRYEKLKQEFIKNPHKMDSLDDDPLSQSKQSVWNQYFNDQDLFAVIKQDVIRTFPGVDFFRKPIIQNGMINILFYYAREHPYMCYRQGMHEILAPILFVMYSDHQSLLHFKEVAKTEIDEVLLNVLDPDFLEADSYSIFSRLMSSIESYYRISNLVQSQGGYFSMQTDNSSPSTEVEVIGQLNSIRDKILAKEDLHLHNYLLKLDIPLHIFGIRWLRLLFGREFPLLDLLLLWDAIFADSDHFKLPNYILVAMLIRIRDKLLLNDYTTCLTFLMRYPANVDINLILRHALHMQMPKKFDRPSNAFIYFTMNADALPMSPPTEASSTLSMQTKKLQATNSARKQSNSSTVDVNYLEPEVQQRARSTSLGHSVQIEKQITLLQARNAADSAAMARLCTAHENDRVIMDGYSDNSPELMRLELKNAQTVITVARNKLQKYLETILRHIPKSNSDEMLQALDGIEELCNFLDVKFMLPISTRGTPIDQALEADENQRPMLKPIPQPKIKVTGEKKTTMEQNYTDVVRNSDILSALEAVALEANTFVPTSTTVINNVTSGSNTNTLGTAYEKPDNGFMLNSYRILGNRKEIELISILTDEKIEEPCRDLQPQQREAGTTQKSAGLPIVNPLEQREE